MKTARKTLVAIILLFATPWTIFAQSNIQVLSQNGLTTTTFSTNSGTIQVYLPNISGSQTISGTIKTLPKGDTKRKQDKNLKALKNLKLNIGNNSINLQSNQFTIASSPTALNLNLEENNTQISATINLNDALNSCSEICIPSYVIAGSPAPISSMQLDGNLSNTSIVLGETQTNILAESENHAFFEVPNNLTGQENLTFNEDDSTTQETVNVLQLNLSAEKLNLLRTETTTLTISVSGLEGLPNDVPLTLTNNSTENIQLQNGNNQDINIPTENDSYTISQTVTAINNGGYSVTASIVPDEFENNETNEPLLCNCIIDDYSYLISPEACVELGGECHTTNGEIEFNSDLRWEKFGDAVGNYSIYNTAFSITDDISELEEKYKKKYEDYEDALKRKKEAEDQQNELIEIDKILDSVKNTYKDKLGKIIDSLQNLKKELPNNKIDTSALKKAVSDAQARVDDCKKRLENLKAKQEELKKQLEADKKALQDAWDEYAETYDDHGMETSSSFDDEGNFKSHVKLKKMTDYERDQFWNDSDIRGELSVEYHKALKAYRNTLKKHKAIPEQISEAQDDCDKLEKALQDAKDAQANGDLAAATELKVEDICEQIKRLLGRLWHWCAKHPDYCTTGDVDNIRIQCPKTPEELEDFWNDFDDLIKKKKGIEDDFAKAANDAQDDINDNENDLDDILEGIDSLEKEKARRAAEALERARKKAEAEAAEAAAAKAAADKRKQERNKQKKKDKEIKDLIKKAKSDDAGTDAFKNLLKGMGLSLLDDATGAGKVGTLIGGILVVKDMPDCACKMFEMLEQAIAAQLRGEDLFRDVFTNEYLRTWNNCANLPVFSSIMIGSKELSEAIGGMSKAQCRKAIDALDQAQRVQCKK